MFRQALCVLFLAIALPMLFVLSFPPPASLKREGGIDYAEADKKAIAASSAVPFVDTHVHLFAVPETPRAASGVVRIFDSLGVSAEWRDVILRMAFPKAAMEFFATPFYMANTYVVADFRRDAEGLQLQKVVHVECGWLGYPPDETAWLQSLADEHGVPHGIVGFADLTKPTAEVEEVLKDHVRHRNFRGVRQSLAKGERPLVMDFAHEELLQNQKWRENFALLSKHGLSFDAWMYHHQLDRFAEFACQFPNTTVVLDHFGTPAMVEHSFAGRFAFENLTATPEGAKWKEGLKKASRCSNVVAKLTGFGMPVNGFGFHRKDRRATREEVIETVQPFLEYTIGLFGVDRVMFGSNFPVDKVSFDYNTWFHSFLKVMENLQIGEEDRDKIMRTNAIRVYRL